MTATRSDAIQTEPDLADSVAAAILAAVNEGFERQLELTRALVTMPSLRGDEALVQDFMAGCFAARGYAVERFAMDPAALAGHVGAGRITAEHSTAVIMAAKNRMDASVNIAVGSSIQIALFVAPLLLFLSYIVGPGPMDLLFTPFEVLAVVLSAGIMAQGNYRALDGFFGMREMHPAQESKTGGQWMDIILHRDFSAHLEAAAAHAARIVLEHEEMPFETALNAIKLAFLRFVHVTYGPTLRGTPVREVPERHAAQRAALAPVLQAPPAEIAAALRAVGALPSVAS